MTFTIYMLWAVGISSVKIKSQVPAPWFFLSDKTVWKEKDLLWFVLLLLIGWEYVGC